MTLIAATFLTVLAAAWRFLDGRGWGGRTTYRNLAGLAIALGCAYVGMGLTWQAGVCALLAWAALVLGYTNWPSWWSVARYGGPACAIAALAYLGGAPVLACALYSLGGVLVGVLYVAMHRPKDAPEDSWRAKDFKWNTAVCETVASSVIVGGLAWIIL